MVNRRRYHIDYEVLRGLYMNDKLSACLIANRLNIPSYIISRMLKKYGLIRSRSDAGKNKYNNFPEQNYGYLHTKEVIDKAQKTKRERYKINPPWVTVEAQAKRSDSLKRFYNEHPERKEKSRIQFIKNVITPKKHHHYSPLGIVLSDEMKNRIRTTVNKNYKDHPEIIEKIRKARSKQIFPIKESSIEKRLQIAMKENGIIFDTQYHLYTEGCATIIDIVILNKKIAIYCDGDYWHNLPSYVKRDKHTNEVLKQLGWYVLRFWEHEINDNVKCCVEHINAEVVKR